MSTPYISVYTGLQVDEGIRLAYLADETLSVIRRGKKSLTPGMIGGSVTGLALSFVPEIVLCSVVIPSDGFNVLANPVLGSLSSDGFSYSLSAAPPNSSYELHYAVVDDGTGLSSGEGAPVPESAIGGGQIGGVIPCFGPPTTPPGTNTAFAVDFDPAATTRLWVYRNGEWEAFG